MSAIRKLKPELNSTEQREFLLKQLNSMNAEQKQKVFKSMPNISQLVKLIIESLADEQNGDLKAILHNNRLIENIKIGLYQALT